MEAHESLEADVERQLMKRGLAPVPGALAFVHRGQAVRLEIGESVYRGLIVTVHDTAGRRRQFRSQDGQFDWDAIASAIVAIAERRHGQRPSARPAPATAPFSIQPAAAPGRMRVNLSNMELDPVAAMQLYVLLRQAGAVA